MEWLIFAVVTAVCYGFFDFFVKKAAGNIDDGLGAMVINLFAFLVMLIYVIYEKVVRHSELTFNREGMLWSIAAGLIVGLLSITFIKMFAAGTNLSLGIVVVRVGAVLVGVALAIFILHEKLTAAQVLGFVMAIAGLGLVLIK
jgi:uncharacterized membrane protein